MIGVYAILNLVTGRCYVGSSVDVPQRWREHLSGLRRGLHRNTALQTDWQRFGAKAFSWTLLQECASRQEAIHREQSAIDERRDLYNQARRAGSGPRDGFKHTEEAKRKISEAAKGKPKPEGFGAKIAALKRGKSNPRHAEALRGRKHSPEHCENIRLSHIGKKHTEETKAKIRAALKGREISWASKMAETKRGRSWSVARRAAFLATRNPVSPLLGET